MAAVNLERAEEGNLAVIFHGGLVGVKLKKALLDSGSKVRHLVSATEFLPVFERPTHTFFFLEPGEKAVWEQLKESLSQAKRSATSLFLVAPDLEITEEKRLRELVVGGRKVRVLRVTGEMSASEAEAQESAENILAWAFMGTEPEGRLVARWRKTQRPVLTGERNRYEKTAFGVLERLEKVGKRRFRGFTVGRRVRRWAGVAMVISILALIVLAPLVLGGAEAISAAGSLALGKHFLEEGDFAAAAGQASEAQVKLGRAEQLTKETAVLWGKVGLGSTLEGFYEAIILGESVAEGMARVARLGPDLKSVAGVFTGGELDRDWPQKVAEIEAELRLIKNDLAFVEAGVKGLATPGKVAFFGFFGQDPKRVTALLAEFPTWEQAITNAGEMLPVLPRILGEGVEGGGEKTYLVVFQNSAELRPTGGFIGSYAVVKASRGTIRSYKVFDVYSADGQLRGRITPPDEILHFLGQPSWYMRDANFAADWPLTARRLEWFLERETGETVDGVVAVNLGLVEKLLAASGPLSVTGYEGTVSAENFFAKAEYQAEINFVPGSTQKSDYLGAVMLAIFQKLTSARGASYYALGKAFTQALAAKDVMVYFNDEAAEAAVREVGWSGSLDRYGCLTPAANCVALVEANFGANKANYFVKREVRVQAVVDKGGGVETTVGITYRNEAPSTSWPGGNYKNYLRILLPSGARLLSLNLGDGRAATVSPVLSADVLAGVKTSQFLVVTGSEAVLGNRETTAGAWTSYGVLVEVPVSETRTVGFRFTPAYRINFLAKELDFRMVILKQPGTGADSLDVAIDYPAFLSPVVTGTSGLVFPQRVIYNTDLVTDRIFTVHFKKEGN